jgi:hypothetical protein
MGTTMGNGRDDERRDGWDGWEDGERNLWWDAPAEGAAGADAPDGGADGGVEREVEREVERARLRAERAARERDRLCQAVAARATELALQAFLLGVGERIPWEPYAAGYHLRYPDVRDPLDEGVPLSVGGRVGELGRAADALLSAQAELIYHLIATGAMETTWRRLARAPRYEAGMRMLWMIVDVIKGGFGTPPDHIWTQQWDVE